jgi:hypothetical protein
MRRRIHMSYEEEDTCVRGCGADRLSYEEEDTYVI